MEKPHRHHLKHMIKIYLSSNKMCQPRVPFWRFLGSSAIKNPPDNAGDRGLSVQSLGSRSPGEGNGNILQCSCLENPMDREAWQATVHGAAKELDTTEQLNNNLMYLWIWCTGKGILSFLCRDLSNHLVHTRVVSIVPSLPYAVLSVHLIPLTPKSQQQCLWMWMLKYLKFSWLYQQSSDNGIVLMQSKSSFYFGKNSINNRMM